MTQENKGLLDQRDPRVILVRQVLWEQLVLKEILEQLARKVTLARLVQHQI